MKKYLLILWLMVCAPFLVFSQTGDYFIPIGDVSGSSTTQDHVELEAASQEILLSLADELWRTQFRVYDFGFYIHNNVTAEGVPEAWAKAVDSVENSQTTQFYFILFGRESDSSGINKKIRVKIRLPEDPRYACLNVEERVALERLMGEVANENLHQGYVKAEIEALKVLKDYIYKVIVCNCANTGPNCNQFSGFRYIDLELRGLGFRKKQIELGAPASWPNGTLGIYDHVGAKVIIDGEESYIPDEISESKEIFDSPVQVLEDTTINTSITGEVYILNNESFVNGEWENAYNRSSELDYVEYWVVLTDDDGNTFLYSRFTIGALGEEGAAARNDNDAGRQLVTLSPCGLALKALGNAAIDVVVQCLISRILDPEVHNFYPDAWGKVSLLGAAWEGISSLLPWKKIKNGTVAIIIRAATSALVVVIDNARKNPNYTLLQGLVDFGGGFGASAITQLVLHPKVTQVIGSGTKYARLTFAKGIKRIYDSATGFLFKVSKKAVKNLAGTITKRSLNEADDVLLINRVKELRGKMPTSDLRKKGNFAHAIATVPGLSKEEYFAHSRIHELNSGLEEIVPEISLKPVRKIFPTSKVASNSGGEPFDRDVDSEYKILTEIAERLGENVNVVGTIKLFTERDTCSSCANVITLFSAIYKKINIEIIHNNEQILYP